MTGQDNLNNYPQAFVLFYVNEIKSDPTIYNTNLTEICDAGYSITSPYNFEITTWYLTEIAEPSLETLMGYDLATVLTWYKGFYEDPLAIALAQPFTRLTSANIANVRTTVATNDSIVYNTTTSKLQYFTGSVWADCFPAV